MDDQLNEYRQRQQRRQSSPTKADMLLAERLQAEIYESLSYSESTRSNHGYGAASASAEGSRGGKGRGSKKQPNRRVNYYEGLSSSSSYRGSHDDDAYDRISYPLPPRSAFSTVATPMGALMTRDITENDYSLLLQLDESVASSKGASDVELSQLPSFSFRQAKDKKRKFDEVIILDYGKQVIVIDDDSPEKVAATVSGENTSCCICLTNYEEGDDMVQIFNSDLIFRLYIP